MVLPRLPFAGRTCLLSLALAPGDGLEGEWAGGDQAFATYDAEEEGGLVGLQGGLWIQDVESMAAVCEGGNHGGAAELFDELQAVSRG